MTNLKLRQANANDIDILFEWANDNAVRQNSFNPGKISFDNHQKWFKNKLASKNTFIYILEKDNKKIGQIRVDFENDFWLIDYSIDKTQRGNGSGKIMIELLLQKKHLPLKAKVKIKNIASCKVFEKLDFTKTITQDNLVTYTYL